MSRPSHWIVAIVGACTMLCAPALASAGTGDILALQGQISPDLKYRIRIDYSTSTNDHACQYDDYITGMWIPQVESRYEAPEISGDRHRLSTPLGRPDGAGACGWRPLVVALCVGLRNASDEATACRTLFLIRPDSESAPEAISLTCDIASWICVDSAGRAAARQVGAIGEPVRLDVLSSGALPRPQAPSGR
jgi:hypothetical protein